MEARVFRSLIDIEDVRSTWVSWQRIPNSDIDVYLRVLAGRPGFIRPHVIVVYRDGSPEAMLVGRVESGALDIRLGYFTLLRRKATLLSFGYGSVLGNLSPEVCSVAMREIRKALREGEADVAYFNHLRTDSPLYHSVIRSAGVLARDYFPRLQTHRSLGLSGGVDGFYSGLGRKSRKNQRRQTNRFLKDFKGSIAVRCFRSGSDLDQVIQDVEAIAKRTYQRSLGVGFVHSSEMHRRLHFEAERGGLRAYVLYVADRPCAFWIGIVRTDTFHVEFTGYDANYADYSPGMFLMMRIIEGFCSKDCADDIREIDFGLGDAQYKKVLGNQEWLDATVYEFAPTFRAIGLNLIRTPLMGVDLACRRILDGAGLMSRTKTAWRNWVNKKNSSVLGGVGARPPSETGS